SCAVQRPMPLPPPVTMMVWPSNSPGLKTERYDMFPHLNGRSSACFLRFLKSQVSPRALADWRNRHMTLAELTAKMKEGASKKSAFGNTVKFATDQGVVYIDGNQNPPSVTNDDKAADCTLRMDFGDFSDMIAGKLDGMTAFMTGKLKIEGDMGVAMKLQSILR